MKALTVIQHDSAEYLGLMEDHFEGRRVRFRYIRPFTGAVAIPDLDLVGDGLVLLGAGPWGTAGERDLPTLAEELALARSCMMANKPVIGIGAGAQIVALAAGGEVRLAPLSCRVGMATRTDAEALAGYVPETFPYVTYGRDKAVPPPHARVFAVDEEGEPLAFQMGDTAFGFAFHPGLKTAMIEDLVMEFEESPEGIVAQLPRVRAAQRGIEDALIPIMTGLVSLTGLMQ